MSKRDTKQTINLSKTSSLINRQQIKRNKIIAITCLFVCLFVWCFVFDFPLFPAFRVPLFLKTIIFCHINYMVYFF